MLRELGCFVFRLAILDLFACLCVVSGVEGMAGQRGRAGAGSVAFFGALGIRHGIKNESGCAGTVPFEVFGLKHGIEPAELPCLLGFLRLGTVGNVSRTGKSTVPFAIFAIRHGRK